MSFSTIILTELLNHTVRTRSLLPYECLLHLQICCHFTQICGGYILPQLFPHTLVRVYNLIQAVPQETHSLLHKIQYKWNRISRQERVAAKDARRRGVSRGEYRHGKSSFYSAIFECSCSTRVIDKVLDRTPDRITSTISLADCTITGDNVRIGRKLLKIIDLHIAFSRCSSKKALHDRAVCRTIGRVRRHSPRIRNIKHTHTQKCIRKLFQSFLNQIHFCSNCFGTRLDSVSSCRIHDGAPNSIGGVIKGIRDGIVNCIQNLLRCTPPVELCWGG
mmetsp:Transcript_19063/g.29808  ORF Transcript_19063/g.29808 Transcript_19063/m.29808 type:complete len:276 (-) Transcript_19063:1155-1982(-)